MLDPVSQMSSLRDVASRINSGSDLAGLLLDLVKAACEHGGWSMGSIMAVDVTHGHAHVVARHDPTLLRRRLEDRWELATSPALVALRTGEPVYIPDARDSEEFPGYRREAFERDYRSVIVLPLTSTDAEDRPMVLSLVSRSVKPVPPQDLAFMGMIAHLGAVAVEREHRLRAERRIADDLRHALVAQSDLLQEVLSGGSAEVLGERLGEFLQCAVLVVDFSANLLVASGSPRPGAFDEAGWREILAAGQADRVIAHLKHGVAREGAGTTELPVAHDGRTLKLAAVVEPLMVEAETVGALVLFGGEHSDDLRRLTLDSAKFALSVQMMRSVIRFRFETRTMTELFFEIVERRWRDPEDIARRARQLGLSLSRPLRMIVVDLPGTSDSARDLSMQAHQSVARLAGQVGMGCLVIAIGAGLVCLISEQDGAKREMSQRFAHRATETLRQVLHGEPIVVIGGLCSELEDYAGEWDRIWRMVRIARSFRRTGVLSALDFGPLPMLIGAADATEVRAFVEGSIGTIAAYDRRHGTPYLETLTAYLRVGCRSQPCADALGLHVTTLRYRLTRIEELFGVSAEAPDKRFALELAVKLHGVIDGQAAPRSAN
jgi:DNA-binding PucR family transcriptional regulator